MTISNQSGVSNSQSEIRNPKSAIIILDFGSQYTQLIARAIRQQGVFSLILPCTTSREDVLKHNPVGLVLSGGPASVTSAGSPRCDSSFLDGSIPVLGICYGMQLLCHELGGKVESASAKEYGRAEISIASINGAASPLFADLAAAQTVWMSHGDVAKKLPSGFHAIARSHGVAEGSGGEYDHIVGMQDESGRRLAVQFHPEVAHTPNGAHMLRNFLFRVCGCKADWTPAKWIEETLAQIREQVGNERVILGYSGGVDSTVAAVLIHRAIGDRLIPIFVDNGLLRLNEREEVAARFRDKVGIPLEVHDAADRFLADLKGVSDPEKKRKSIGKNFIDAFSECLRAHATGPQGAKFLAQGTLYPDVIESRSASGGPSATIKTHHNVGGLPADLKFELLEPLRWLFKDDVRRVGRELGIDEDLIGRHPFPGPGLAVRILGEVTPERLRIVREADAIFIHELRAGGCYDKVSQALTVLLPVKSVGVMGDARTYEEVIALRAVTTGDFMTADWAVLPPDMLGRISNRIINEVRGVNRVVYDISSKPPATIEWE